MSPDEMFFAYRMLNPSASDYGHCLFSSIASSILSGTASSAAVAEETFTLTGDELPSVGDIQCVTGEDGSALALVRITSVRIVRGCDLPSSTPAIPRRSEDSLYCLMDFRLIFQ